MNTKLKYLEQTPFDPYLQQGETILWMGQPNPLLLFSPGDILLIPFSLLWGGFAIFWLLGVWTASAPTFFMLWGIPFVVVGQYFIWGRFVHKFIRRRHTYYAISDRRAFVLTWLLKRDLKVYFLHQFSSLNRRGGTVLFGVPSDTPNMRRNVQDWSGEAQPGFYGLHDADEVYRLMQDQIMPPKLKRGWESG